MPTQKPAGPAAGKAPRRAGRKAGAAGGSVAVDSVIDAAVDAAGPVDSRPQPQPQPLPPSFYARPTLLAARALLGQHLCFAPAGETALRIGRIVEVEAYLGPEDRASHARLVRRGGGLVPSPRSSLMFGPVGRAYVYLIYGMHHCFNVVAHPDEQVGAVLVRALQPVSGSLTAAGAATAGPATRSPLS